MSGNPDGFGTFVNGTQLESSVTSDVVPVVTPQGETRYTPATTFTGGGGGSTSPSLLIPAAYAPGNLTTRQRILRHTAAVAFYIANGATNSGATADVPATSNSVFDISRAPAASANSYVKVGSFTFPSGSANPVASFTFASTISWVAGDVLVIDAPTTADSVLQGVAVSLYGVRT